MRCKDRKNKKWKKKKRKRTKNEELNKAMVIGGNTSNFNK